ncbi:acyltransferase family protein [Lachnospiraceae bacterium OttesenSCG-928-D06]|nr:acyltransferase family protein [Lachnospiraceae bacterium OttesenSCG-928-D06]
MFYEKGKDSEVEKRKTYFDLLRIVACFSVVMLHSAAQFWYDLPIRESEWLIANAYDAVFRFGVPIFVMLSGALFLDTKKERSIKYLYTHNIFRLLCIYIVWSCIYGLLDVRYLSIKEVGVKFVIKEMIFGRYHLWFLPMLIGLYALLPILKTWIAHTDKKGIQYFLGLFLVIQIGGETLRSLIPSDMFALIADRSKIDLICGYAGYFVLGYYLVFIGMKREMHKWIYIGAFFSAVLNIVLSTKVSWRLGEANASVYDSYSLFTFFIVLGVFLFFKEKVGNYSFSERGISIIKEISQSTLGIYLLHVGVLEVLQAYGLHSKSIFILFGVPLLSIGCFLLCFLLTFFLRRIPVVGRYIC